MQLPDSSIIVHGLQAHDAALTMIRASVGAFFAISGFHKLFNRERHRMLVATFRKLRIPFIRFNQWWVPSVEFIAGIAITLGFFTIPAALLLVAICLVATLTDGLKRIGEMKPIDRADYCDDLLYLPEVLYGVMLAAILFIGPGSFSIDQLIFG